MSLDLFPNETVERVGRMAPAPTAEVGTFDGFIRGTPKLVMRNLTQFGSAIDLLGAVGPIVEDAFTGGTEAQDRYFKEHEDLYGKAIDYWTPNANEVGTAAHVTASLLSTIPLVIANPSLAVGATQVSTAEDLVKKGVDATKAQAVGAVQAAGLGLGIYMPILGNTLAQRVLLGGVGFNMVQGTVTRGVSGEILQGTPASEDFKAFDPTQMTLDVLLGAAFGAIAHLSPSQRAQGSEMMTRLENWAKGLKSSDIDALAVLRQAEHMNVDSMPGKAAEPVDVERHVQRMRQAIDQLSRDKPVEVSDLPAPKFEADTARAAQDVQNLKTLSDVAEQVRQSEGLPPVPETTRVSTESEAPAATPVATEPPPRGQRGAEAAGAEVNPLQAEAERIVTDQPDLQLRVGTDADGTPIVKSAKDYLEESKLAAEDARGKSTLYQIAAQCLLGRS